VTLEILPGNKCDEAVAKVDGGEHQVEGQRQQDESALVRAVAADVIEDVVDVGHPHHGAGGRRRRG